ncbi:microfibrillar-associated protein 5-like isoform X2 [Cavia porcellus]|uniref:microfibrillar-associated protein 5-like isoform X2 n=1 Tax=Cavia porcellus TaxID=10141 RepID=UPI002FE07D00
MRGSAFHSFRGARSDSAFCVSSPAPSPFPLLQSRPNPNPAQGGAPLITVQAQVQQSAEDSTRSAAAQDSANNTVRRGCWSRGGPRRCCFSQHSSSPLGLWVWSSGHSHPISSFAAGWITPGVSGQQQDLVNDPSTDETVLADIEPSTDDLASTNDKNATAECRDEKFACTRLYSVHRPVRQCVHQVCFTSVRRTYIINNEICSRLVCKEHEAMKDELCRQRAGLPPRRLRRSSYFRLPLCDNVDSQ